MTKLPIERLEYYAELPAAPAERKAIFMYEVRCMARQLLAYEQAAKNPVAIIENSEYMTAEQLAGEEPHKKAVKELYEGALVVGSKLYAAPVLPKQPETQFDEIALDTAREIMRDVNQRQSIHGGECQLLARIQCRINDVLCNVAAPAQPVIQEQTKYQQLRDIVLLTANNLIQSGYSPKENSLHPWESLLFDAEKALAAQPVSEPYKLISVKDDTPTESGDYWCYLGKDFESPTKYRVVHFDVRHHEFQDHRVTHWMRLPAEPEREA